MHYFSNSFLLIFSTKLWLSSISQACLLTNPLKSQLNLQFLILQKEVLTINCPGLNLLRHFLITTSQNDFLFNGKVLDQIECVATDSQQGSA